MKLRTSNSPRLGVAAAISVALLSIAACSGTGGAGKAGSPVSANSTDDLYKQAKEIRGGLISYATGIPAELEQPTIDAFEKKYPGLKVKLTRVVTNDLTTQLQTQAVAGSVQYDLVESAPGSYADTLDSKDLIPKVGWAKYGVPASRVLDVSAKGNAVFVYDLPEVVVYNTDLVKPEDAPKTWDDLLNPRWKGKVVVDGRGSFLGGWAKDPKLTPQAGLALATKIREDQAPIIQKSLSGALQAVSSGQAEIGTVSLNTALAQKAQGAPIGFAKVSPISGLAFVNFAPNGAPNGPGGQLLASYLGSDEGQAVLSKSFYGVSAPCDANPAAKELCALGITNTVIKDPETARAVTAYQDQVAKALGATTN